MAKLFCILGKSGSGKSTLAERINSSGIAKKIITTTTREKRSNEENGRDYHFISENVFRVYLSQGQYAEFTSYDTVNGKVYYGTNKNDIKLEEGNKIIVVNPEGYRQLKRSLGEENVVGIYIKRNDKERVISAIKRDDNDLLNKLDEIKRRLVTDNEDFKGIEDEVDYIVYNDDFLNYTLFRMEEIIREESTKRMKKDVKITVR